MWIGTMGIFLSFGLKHRMKKGWQRDRAFIRESRDWRNWPLRVDICRLESFTCCVTQKRHNILQSCCHCPVNTVSLPYKCPILVVSSLASWGFCWFCYCSWLSLYSSPFQRSVWASCWKISEPAPWCPCSGSLCSSPKILTKYSTFRSEAICFLK